MIEISGGCATAWPPAPAWTTTRDGKAAKQCNHPGPKPLLQALFFT
ncbi:MAG TPA: hypothetical protein VG013_14510 [Gemmataceae bacterium]|nr:hypothetical protein [Gemmataceae bacterium]